MWNEGQTAAMTVCVGEWSRRARCSCVYIHSWCQVTRSLVLVRQWTSRVARWHLLWSCSTAEQATATTTCRRRHKLTTEATDTIMLRPADVSTVRSTWHWVVACRLRIHYTLTHSLTHSLTHCFTRYCMTYIMDEFHVWDTYGLKIQCSTSCNTLHKR